MNAKYPRDDIIPDAAALPKRGVTPSFRPIRDPSFLRARATMQL